MYCSLKSFKTKGIFMNIYPTNKYYNEPMKSSLPNHKREAIIVKVEGIVQGVGFRPFIWKLAKSLSLAGNVQNNPDGVRIWVEGNAFHIKEFLSRLQKNPPPLAKILSIQTEVVSLKNLQDFTIQESTSTGDFSTHIMPDISLCIDCHKELFDPSNRRYHYPFINCTNCGPRFSIIKKLPYDRATTSMSGFNMCPDCAAEYSDPADRRYHAQPVACPICGPQVVPLLPDGTEIKKPWQEVWKNTIEQGQVVALKGIGGFHLACNALDEQAAAVLRSRKQREAKPFAIMTPDIEWIKSVCWLSEAEEKLLCSRECPIVILRLKKDFPALQHIAPGLDTLGIMVPYSPLHEILFDVLNIPMVMTSANYSNEPMIHTNHIALHKLRAFADVFLMHNRDIVNRCDDSVCTCIQSHSFVIRPGRGVAPFPISCKNVVQSLAFGADMKNTFAVSHHDRISVSQYIGDLEHPEAQQILLSNINQQLDFFKANPEFVMHDLHPDYFSTRLACRFAQEKNISAFATQHHHTHLAAGHAEHGITGKAIGFAFDGTGYGTDKTIWGGEVMLFDRSEFNREYYLKPVSLPGGDIAVKHPDRMLVSYLLDTGLLDKVKETRFILSNWDDIVQMIMLGINCPKTSSAGRLFDAVACLLGVCSIQTYDGEAAMKLEAVASKNESGSFPFEINGKTVDCTAMFNALLEQVENSIPVDILAGRFHNTLVEILFDCGKRLIHKYGDLPWVFSGGVFQNRLLIEKILSYRDAHKYKLFFSTYPNDSGISLGQAIIGINSYKDGSNFLSSIKNGMQASNN